MNKRMCCDVGLPIGKLTFHHDGGNEHYHDEKDQMFSKKYVNRIRDKKFQGWMVELHTFATQKWGFPIGSACEMAVRPGAIEEVEWYEFYRMGMDPYEALLADANGE